MGQGTSINEARTYNKKQKYDLNETLDILFSGFQQRNSMSHLRESNSEFDEFMKIDDEWISVRKELKQRLQNTLDQAREEFKCEFEQRRKEFVVKADMFMHEHGITEGVTPVCEDCNVTFLNPCTTNREDEMRYKLRGVEF